MKSIGLSNGHIVSPLRSWYSASIDEFLHTPPYAVLGRLSTNCDFDLNPNQRDAWLIEVEIFRSELQGIDGHIFLEFNIPRMGRRADAILIIGPIVFVIEFKIGEKIFDRSANDQVWDYALDLKNFHKASHDVTIVPVLVVTEAKYSPPVAFHADSDGVYRPIHTIASGLRSVLDASLKVITGSTLDVEEWAGASYHPTPNIVEAARALYSQHSVDAIACFDAGKQNLGITSGRIEELSDEARAKRQKMICFVTGVPGAGKTLVGLNLATRRHEGADSIHAVFLSGNGPLVEVLREALTRDEFRRRKNQGENVRKTKIGENVKAFIQNVHHFRGDRWLNIANADNRIYLRNAYRVLLTRARQGMVIFVPPGDQGDPTRPPAFYDPTFHYLRDLGIPEIR